MADEAPVSESVETAIPAAPTGPVFAEPSNGDPAFGPIVDTPVEAAATPEPDSNVPPKPETASPEPSTEGSAGEPEALSDDDVKVAERYGMSADQARALGTKVALDRVLIALDRQMANIHQKLGPQPAPAQEPPKPEPKPAAPQPTPTGGDYAAYQPEINAEEYPELHAEISRLAQHVQAQVTRQLQALTPRFDATVGAVNQAQELALIGHFDGILAKYGKDYEPFIGEGHTLELDPQSEQAKARVEVYHTMNALRNNWARMGQNLNLKESVQRALRSVLGDKLETIARKKAEADIAAKRANAVPRPSRPGTVRSNGRSADAIAQANLARRMKELGIGAPSLKERDDELAGMTLGSLK